MLITSRHKYFRIPPILMKHFVEMPLGARSAALRRSRWAYSDLNSHNKFGPSHRSRRPTGGHHQLSFPEREMNRWYSHRVENDSARNPNRCLRKTLADYPELAFSII